WRTSGEESGLVSARQSNLHGDMIPNEYRNGKGLTGSLPNASAIRVRCCPTIGPPSPTSPCLFRNSRQEELALALRQKQGDVGGGGFEVGQYLDVPAHEIRELKPRSRSTAATPHDTRARATDWRPHCW